MSGPLQSIPADLEGFSGPSSLLPGENEHDFEIIRRMMIEEIRPKTNMEWLWILDLTELSWEILRYRRLKEKIIQIYRANAIASILQRVDGAGMPPQNKMLVKAHSKGAAIEWSTDPTAASEIEARLQRSGFDLCAINAEVFLQAKEPFSLFDGLMQSAQQRRAILLREVTLRREFAKRRASNAVSPRTMGRPTL